MRGCIVCGNPECATYNATIAERVLPPWLNIPFVRLCENEDCQCDYLRRYHLPFDYEFLGDVNDTVKAYRSTGRLDPGWILQLPPYGAYMELDQYKGVGTFTLRVVKSTKKGLVQKHVPLMGMIKANPDFRLKIHISKPALDAAIAEAPEKRGRYACYLIDACATAERLGIAEYCDYPLLLRQLVRAHLYPQ